jgi:4-hydroxyphenylacetate 3-hydroxylase, reductase component
MKLHALSSLRTGKGLRSGVAVISARDADLRPYGLTVSDPGSLSLEAPLVQWSVKECSHSYTVFRQAELFAVNILAADQAQVSRNFARPIDRFATVLWENGFDGLPLIHGAVAWLECARERTLRNGDRRIFIGRMLRVRTFDRKPLVPWGGFHSALERGQAA